VRIENADLVVDLPDTLAQLLIERNGWRKTRRAVSRPEPLDFDRAAVDHAPLNDDPIPMTHIPGVVPGVTMNEIKKWVADGTVPVVMQGRTKLVRPSDVAAANEAAK
jgi:hypothetical protein